MQRSVQRELKVRLRENKEKYRRKLENKLQNSNVRDAWMGMKTISGFKVKENQAEGSLNRANELNTFFNRFSTGPSATSPSHLDLSSPLMLGQPVQASSVIMAMDQCPQPSTPTMDTTWSENPEPAPYPSHLFVCIQQPGENASEETSPEQGPRSGYQPKGPKGICETALWYSALQSQMFFLL